MEQWKWTSANQPCHNSCPQNCCKSCEHYSWEPWWKHDGFCDLESLGHQTKIRVWKIWRDDNIWEQEIIDTLEMKSATSTSSRFEREAVKQPSQTSEERFWSVKRVWFGLKGAAKERHFEVVERLGEGEVRKTHHLLHSEMLPGRYTQQLFTCRSQPPFFTDAVTLVIKTPDGGPIEVQSYDWRKVQSSDLQCNLCMEVQCKDDEPDTAVNFRRTGPVPTTGGITGEQPPESTRDLPRGATAVEAGRKRKTWLENLN